MTFDRLSRRKMLLGAAGLTAVSTLSACGRAEAPVDESGRVRLRLAAASIRPWRPAPMNGAA